MYSDWASLASAIEENIINAQSKSVLTKLPAAASKDVATTVIRQIATSLSIAQSGAEPKMVALSCDAEVLWCMDVICYGLSLPVSEHETIKDCVNIYCVRIQIPNVKAMTTCGMKLMFITFNF